MLTRHRTKLAALCGLALTSVGGCASVHEQHYFASYTEGTLTEPARLVNIFRLDVDAQGGFANIRYLAGNYDERAVEYFLNEVKSTEYSPGEGNKFPKIWNLACPTPDKPDTANVDECKVAYENALRVMPLSGSAQGPMDTFVIILSTNATAISETIGSIAENTVVLKSLSYLLNRDTFEAEAALDETRAVDGPHRKAFVAALAAQTASYSDDDSASAAKELSILRMLAAELDPDSPVNFLTLDEAKKWFAGQK